MIIHDKNKCIRIGIRKKDEIRECYFCGKDCKKEYYCGLVELTQRWICKNCSAKIIKYGLIKGKDGKLYKAIEEEKKS